MQQGIPFFDRISYDGFLTCGQTIHHFAEWYCSGSNRNIYIVDSAKNHWTLMQRASSSGLKESGNIWCVAKKIQQIAIVASYFTVVIPLALLLVKAIMRYRYQYRPFEPSIIKSPLFPVLEWSSNDSSPTGVTPVDVSCGAARVYYRRSTRELVERYGSLWKEDGTFEATEEPFDCDSFIAFLQEQTKQFTQSGLDASKHFGYIEKFELEPKDETSEPAVYVRGALRGDLKSLCENLKALQKLGFLDAHFRCKKGFHLVFLGNYCNRENYGIPVLEILMQLRSENRNSVHLIRGNHEDMECNGWRGMTDGVFQAVSMNQFYTYQEEIDDEMTPSIEASKVADALTRFYTTLPLCVYAGLKNRNGSCTYIQCTHGLFEATLDPSELLDQSDKSVLFVPKERKLCERIVQLASGDEEGSKVEAAKKVLALAQSFQRLEPNINAYNFGDVSFNQIYTPGNVNNLGYRFCRVHPIDIHAYLEVSSTTAKVLQLFYGHERKFRHFQVNQAVTVTALPVGVECMSCAKIFQLSDITYILSSDPSGDWEKRVMQRASGSSDTKIVGPFPLTADEMKQVHT